MRGEDRGADFSELTIAEPDRIPVGDRSAGPQPPQVTVRPALVVKPGNRFLADVAALGEADRTVDDPGFGRHVGFGHVEPEAGPAPLDPEDLGRFGGNRNRPVSFELGSDRIRGARIADHVQPERGNHDQAAGTGDHGLGEVVFTSRREAGHLDRGRPDQREEGPIGLPDLDLAADLVHREVLQQGRAGGCLGVDQKAFAVKPQDSHFGLKVAFAVEQSGIYPGSGCQFFGLVGHLALQEPGCVRPGDFKPGPVGPFDQAAFLADLPVLGVKVGFGHRGHGPILRRANSRRVIPGASRTRAALGFALMALAQDFQDVLDSLPADWTDLEFDLRIDDEDRYIDASVHLSLINAQPYSQAEWHWRVPVAHSFGKAAAPQTVLGVLRRLDKEGFTGELNLREVREGRSEVVQMWGRPESVREEFRQRRSI